MSLRTSISLALFAMLLTVGVLSSALVYAVASYETGQFMDDQMRQLASVVDERTRPGAIGALQEPEDRFAVTLWTSDHRRVVLAEPGLDLEPAALGFASRNLRGAAWRTFAARADGRTTVVAQRASAREEMATHAAMEVALPILASAPLAWLVVGATVARLLRPMTRLGRAIEGGSIEGADTGAEAIPAARLPLEVLPFVDAINRLLFRLRAAMDRQRRFVADSAHQLRTPLAAMRLQIDNLSDGGSSDDGTLPLQDGMRRVGTMLNQLLELAKLDGCEPRVRSERVQLAEVLTESVADRIGIADDKAIDLGILALTPATATLGRADLVLLIGNVLDNAVRYTPRGGRVDCSLTTRDGIGRIIVEDTGPGVSEDDLPHLTERFYRGAGAEGEGSGLGLSIAKAAAERNNLRLTIENRRPPNGLVVVIGVALDPEVFAALGTPS